MADTESFEALLRQYESAKTGPAKGDPQVGDKVTGKVIYNNRRVEDWGWKRFSNPICFFKLHRRSYVVCCMSDRM